MPKAGFETTIPVKRVHALDRAVTVIGIGDLHRNFDQRFQFLRYNPILYEDGVDVTYSRFYKIILCQNMIFTNIYLHHVYVVIIQVSIKKYKFWF
jgi:hypothetical protein